MGSFEEFSYASIIVVLVSVSYFRITSSSFNNKESPKFDHNIIHAQHDWIKWSTHFQIQYSNIENETIVWRTNYEKSESIQVS